ncbi:MAG: DMT family transporter [Candidatus Neomarinimicrobiota bacterium]|nr:DMT family transporter [Candidatus Neomarinimicrobiota bacterium]
MTQNKLLAKIALILVAMIWGITFIMVKDALNDAPPFSFASLRFGIASLITLLLLNNRILLLTKNEIIGGMICGSFLYFGYAFQNFGLMHTTASKSAFITSVSVLMVPFILLILNIQKIDFKTWIAVILATIGLYLLLVPGENKMNFGDILTFGCALSFAIHIVAQDNYIKKTVKILPFFFIQVVFVTLLSFFSAFLTETESIIWSNRLLIAIMVTGIFATFAAILIMIWAQKILKPTETALIFSLEPVAATMFAMMFASEFLGFWGWIGGALICFAVAFGESNQSS